MALNGPQRQALNAALAKIDEINTLDTQIGRRHPNERVPVANAVFEFRTLIATLVGRGAAWADYADQLGEFRPYAGLESGQV